MTLTEIKDIAAIVGPIFTFFAVVWAAYVYNKNSRLERAKWLASLYEKFYEKDHLKAIRDKLDCDDDVSLEIPKLISEGSAKFSDYLNFFEFVAFLKNSKQLKYQEVEQLFGYYLSCLNRRQDVRQYVSEKGYELLNELLKEFAEKKK